MFFLARAVRRVVGCPFSPGLLTERLEEGDAGAARVRHGVVANDRVVGGAVEHDPVHPVVEDNVVLDRNIVAPVSMTSRRSKKCGSEGLRLKHHDLAHPDANLVLRDAVWDLCIW